MTEERRYINNKPPHIAIDPADEGVVIVSDKGCTRIWVDGKEVKKCTKIDFTAGEDEPPKLNLEIIV